ncbi:hypothetical protein V1514DRAFT_271824, partial [Lipomyces japonicus]|uniref:uncharacterized protein n=1 Tax=Lipomyces japonicus TaxID=56871 RepID=UPI0034CE6E11
QAHSLLSQVPLILSPFLKAPQPVILPSSYAALPRSLPPSSAVIFDDVRKIAKSIESQANVTATRHKRAKVAVDQWDGKIKQDETLQARRLAPGYADSNVHLLQPR